MATATTFGPGAETFDERSPFEAAAAAAEVIARDASGLPTADAVWDAFAASKGEAWRAYLAAIRRTRHSCFSWLLQELYEFGRARLPAGARDGLCLAAGRRFAEGIFAETVHPLVEVALAEPGALQRRAADVIRAYLARYASVTYTLDARFGPDALDATLAYADPAQAQAVDAAHGLDAGRAFRNSAEFIAGAVDAFAARAVADYDATAFRLAIDGCTATLHVPIRAGDRFAYDRLLATLAAQVRELDARQRAAAADSRRTPDAILGAPGMRETWDRLQRASRTDALVLLCGESGTGKSHLARRLHEASPRRAGPFVEVGCTADVGSDNLVQSDLFGHERGAFTGATEPKTGLFALADGGTLFLDEIGDASPELQAKLLRVIESGVFRRLGGTRDQRADVRIVAATNRDLARDVRDGRFREDLYHRLNVIQLTVPPLRERAESVAPLAEQLLARAVAASRAPARTLPETLLHRLRGYPWPGNVRELDHALTYAATMAEGEVLTERDLPDTIRAWLQGAPAASPGPAADGHAPEGPIDPGALDAAVRRAIAAGPPPAGPTHADPAHVDHARRAWLAALIDACDGDLRAIGARWDRGSEKTLRKLIQSWGLAERLAVARAKARAVR